MNRRFLFALAAAVVGLVAISPVLAVEQSTLTAGVPVKGSSTTAPADDSTGSTDEAMEDPDADSGSESDTGSGTDDSGPDSTEPTRKGGSSSTTATTGRSGPGSGSGGTSGRSSSECDPPVTDRGPAPQIGEPPQSWEAGEAGTVEVERLSETELRIAGATANDGWTEQIAKPSGPRVTVKFVRQGESPTLIRFAATMDQKGTEIHTRVTSCG